MEFVVIVPFVLVLLAAVWDLRTYIGYRTELVRETYVVAEAIAKDATGSAPFETAMGQAIDWLQEDSRAGVVRAAVVARGTERPDGSVCPADEWCLPMVTVAWPAAADDATGTWSLDDGNVCAGGNLLPAAGDHFATRQRVLPAEGVDPDGDGTEVAPPEQDWISRNLSNTQWWVVVDTCVDPQPGLFIGRLTNTAARMLDTSFAMQRRAVWGSIHDRGDCDWCG